MRGWDSICSAARNVVSDCSDSLSGRYPAEKMSEIQKIMHSNWDSLRENAPDQCTFWTTVGKYTLVQIIPQIIQDSGLPGAKPLYGGAKLMYRAWKESQRNKSGVASQLHGHDKDIGERISIHDEREMAVEWAKYMALREELQRLIAQTKPAKASQTQGIMKIAALTNQPFSPEAVMKALKQSQVSQDCSDDVEIVIEDK